MKPSTPNDDAAPLPLFHPDEESREGEQYNGGDGCESQGRWDGGEYQGGIFEDVEEVDDLCGAEGGLENEVFSYVKWWGGRRRCSLSYSPLWLSEVK